MKIEFHFMYNTDCVMFYIKRSNCTLLYGSILYYIGYKSKGVSCNYQFLTYGCDNSGLRLMYGLRDGYYVHMADLVCSRLGIGRVLCGDVVHYLPRYYRELCIRLRDTLDELISKF